MLPIRDLRERLSEIYSDDRVDRIIREFEEAQRTVGVNTMVQQMSGKSGKRPCMLVVRESDDRVTPVQLTVGKHMIGRLPSCDITLNDMSVSRVHCIMTVHTDGRVAIRDLGSVNGVTVGATRLAPVENRYLGNGEVIMLGRARILFFNAT